jgi:hypothetical protein
MLGDGDKYALSSGVLKTKGVPMYQNCLFLTVYDRRQDNEIGNFEWKIPKLYCNLKRSDTDFRFTC